MLKLNNKVSIYVPSTQQTGQPVKHRSMTLKAVKRHLSAKFGGYTELENTNGGYTLENGDLQSEKVNIVYAFTDTMNDSIVSDMGSYCEKLKKVLNQESIGLEINNDFYLI